MKHEEHGCLILVVCWLLCLGILLYAVFTTWLAK